MKEKETTISCELRLKSQISFMIVYSETFLCFAIVSEEAETAKASLKIWWSHYEKRIKLKYRHCWSESYNYNTLFDAYISFRSLRRVSRFGLKIHHSPKNVNSDFTCDQTVLFTFSQYCLLWLWWSLLEWFLFRRNICDSVVSTLNRNFNEKQSIQNQEPSNFFKLNLVLRISVKVIYFKPVCSVLQYLIWNRFPV